ncbi:MAG: fatty acid desaturase [Cyanobacteria bacterium J06588_4]
MTAVFPQSSESSSSPQLADDVKLRDIISTLPKEVFVKNPRKAWTKLVINVVCVAAAYWTVAVSPWYLLPVAWIFLGTSLQGFFVIAHDCGHRSFSNRIWVNDLVGHAMTLLIIYPYHAWRLLHNHHHRHTNKLDVDNAWSPFTPETYDNASPVLRWLYRRMRGWFWGFGSIAHWAKLHFTWSNFEGKQREQVRFSVLLVVIGGGLIYGTLFVTTGFAGLFKFWLMPWLVYHFWMSTFTMFHHTMPEIPFKPEGEWNEARAQLSGTVNCKYPWWVEFLCHDINVHIPHHLTTAIPWYNLRLAHASLAENWGEYLYPDCTFNWDLIQKVTKDCHLYEGKNTNYQSVEDYRLSKSAV